jgi:hypothetical protein
MQIESYWPVVACPSHIPDAAVGWVRKAAMAMGADGDGAEIGVWPSLKSAGPPLVLPLCSPSPPLLFCWILFVAMGTPAVFYRLDT